MKIDTALTRLINLLPLKDNQDKCSPEVKKLHQAILSSFVEKGRILNRGEMAEYTDDVDNAIITLKNYDMIVVADNGEVIGAYPLTMEQRVHAVQVNNHTVYAMCALDALGVSPMFGMDTEISSQCRVTQDSIFIKQSSKTITNLNETGGVHFGIIWAAASEDGVVANTLCLDMIFLKDKEIAQQWLAEDSANREVFTLEEAVEFSARFFVPLFRQ